MGRMLRNTVGVKNEAAGADMKRYVSLTNEAADDSSWCRLFWIKRICLRCRSMFGQQCGSLITASDCTPCQQR